MRNVSKVFVEVMGRHAGWIAGAVHWLPHSKATHRIILSRKSRRSAALLDKVASVTDALLSSLRKAPAQPTVDYCLIRASGMPSDTRNWVAWHHPRGYGEEHLGYKYHWAVADYLQRAARHQGQTDVDQAFALKRPLSLRLVAPTL